MSKSMPLNNTVLRFEPATTRLICQGKWSLAGDIAHLKTTIEKIKFPNQGELTIDGSGISALDSSGAWQLGKLLTKLTQQGLSYHLQGFSESQLKLLSLNKKSIQPPKTQRPNWTTRIGIHTIQQLRETRAFLTFIGELTVTLWQILRNPKRIRWRALASTIEISGYQALPIIALLSFMIGVVLTYQMGLQLRTYGANIFIVDLLGLAILREFGCLLTAIMIAGRTGSAFTAQLGTMKLNEEIYALKTMGITPSDLLLLPKIAGLFIALPLLTIWADAFSILGGMVMAKSMLNVSWYDFLHRFHTNVSLNSLLIGLGKAPVFALIIASIGCFQGMQVAGGADSVGRQTTRSVVQAIFFIIVADAIFSVIFSKLGI